MKEEKREKPIVFVMWEYKGAIHAHTTFSDGTFPPERVVSEAQAADLDFLVITDHDSLAAKDSMGEGYYGKILVLVGCEISPDHNHYLALGINETPPNSLDPAEFVAQVRGGGGTGFAAHPFDRGNHLLGIPDYAWTDDNCRDWDGIEVWNFASQWVGGTASYGRLILGLFNPGWIVRSPDSKAMALWDEISSRRPCPAVAGIDAHGHNSVLGRLPLAPFNYRQGFRTLQNRILLDHPLSGDGTADLTTVITALREGKNYLCNASLGDPQGFLFMAEGSGQTWGMGDRVSASGTVRLTVRSPSPGLIRLLRMGQQAACVRGRELTLEAGPGVYRAEVWKGGWTGPRVWVVSNPIYITGGTKK